MDFERTLNELEEIVAKLDSPAVTLDEGIALFDRGIECSKQCLAALKESKGRVALLKKELDAVTSQAFDIDADN